MSNLKNQKFLFVPSNGNQVKMFRPLIEKLREAGGDFYFISPDQFYRQNANIKLKESAYKFEELICSTEMVDWWGLTEDERKPLAEPLYEQFERIFVKQKPTCLITGNSLGEIEQIAIRIAEKFNIATVQIQDGVVMSEPLNWQRAGVHRANIFDGGCELACVWGEYLKGQFTKYGFSGRICNTGNPRYDILSSWKGYQPHSGSFTVLLATQCWTRYKAMTPAQEISIYQRIIEQILVREDVRIFLKPHPATINLETYERMTESYGGRVEFINQGDSIDILRSIDLLVTVTSTVSVEAGLMGIPVAKLDYLMSDSVKIFELWDKSFEENLASSEFPLNFLGWRYTSEQLYEKYTRSVDGLSTERTLNAIIDLLKERQQYSKTEKPELSVIVEVNEVDPVSSVASVLRQTDVNLEVIAVDCSENHFVAKKLEECMKDPRLKVYRGIVKNFNGSLRGAIDICGGRYIGKVDGRCIVYPGWASRIVDELKQDNNAACGTSWFGLRNGFGISQTIHTTAPRLSPERLAQDSRWGLFIRAYVVNADRLREVTLPNDNDANYDLNLIARVSGSTNQDTIRVIPGLLFLTPFVRPASILPLREDIKKREIPKVIRENSSKSPEVSVILCSYNRAERVARCLKALENQSIGQDNYEVVCVNDGSTDATGQAMQDGLKRVRGVYLEHETNRALAAGRNTAIANANGKLLLFINDDTYASPDFLEQHLKTHNEHTGKQIAVLGYLPFVAQEKRRIFSLALMQSNLYFGFTGMQPNVEYPFWYFITGNLSVPRECFVDNDIWFDETFLRYGYEDIECGYRLWQLGLSVYYNPRAQALHDHHITIENFIKRESDNAANILQFCIKHPNPIIAETLLTVPRITKEIIEEWETTVLNSSSQIGVVVDEIRKVQDAEPQINSTESNKHSLDLVKSVGESTALVAHITKLKTFLEVFKEHPEIKETLMSESWHQACLRPHTS
jgi:glycosyltransferase involved in cell wall biosynthesis